MTPGAWLEVLEPRLSAQQKAIALPSSYYAGNHRLAFMTAKFREAFGPLFRRLSVNWCRIVVDASSERLAVEGFRFGESEEGDKEAWNIWQANGLDADSAMAHMEAVKVGQSYVLVAPASRDSGYPRITVEHPSQVTVAHAADDRRQRDAALKKWVGDDGYAYANVYLPNEIAKFRSKERYRPGQYGTQTDWVRRQDDPGGPNPLGVVPVVPLYNNPSMFGEGQSDLDVAIPIQDAINKEVGDALVASEFAAYPQRVLTGVEIPKDDNGQPLRQHEVAAAVSRFWNFKDPDVKVQEFTAADLGNYTTLIKQLREDLAALTRTPPHYMIGSIVNSSGDALKAAETGLVAKVRRKQIDFSDSWEEVIRLAFKLMGKADRARDMNAETIWRDPENRSDAEKVDAAVKLRTLGVPLEACWQFVGATDKQVREWKTLTGLPDRPPAGATTADVPPVLGGTSSNGTAQQ